LNMAENKTVHGSITLLHWFILKTIY
jgi:hypothetical protein